MCRKFSTDYELRYYRRKKNELKDFLNMSQPGTDTDFQPLPSYTQTTVKNESWVNVTLTKTDSDGTVSQTFFIAKK